MQAFLVGSKIVKSLILQESEILSNIPLIRESKKSSANEILYKLRELFSMLRIILLCFLPFIVWANDTGLKITTSIMPLQSIIANLTKDTNSELNFLVEKDQSLHNYFLKPSQASSLYKSDMVIIIDSNFELFMDKMLVNLKRKNKRIIETAKFPGLELIKNDEEEHHHHDHDEDDGHHHHVGEYDLHYWLDIAQVKIVAKELVNIFKEVDQKNAQKYQTNLDNFIIELDSLDSFLSKRLETVKDKEYIVTHNAYDYFVRRYGLKKPKAITIDHDQNIGAKTFHDLQIAIKENKIACIFEEPQFNSSHIEKLKSIGNVKIGRLDAEWGPSQVTKEESYFIMMKNLANSFAECLK